MLLLMLDGRSECNEHGLNVGKFSCVMNLLTKQSSNSKFLSFTRAQCDLSYQLISVYNVFTILTSNLNLQFSPNHRRSTIGDGGGDQDYLSLTFLKRGDDNRKAPKFCLVFSFLFSLLKINIDRNV